MLYIYITSEDLLLLIMTVNIYILHYLFQRPNNHTIKLSNLQRLAPLNDPPDPFKSIE